MTVSQQTWKALITYIPAFLSKDTAYDPKDKPIKLNSIIGELLL